MKYLGYSELTKRVYIIPSSAKKPKIDITDDINEYIEHIQPASQPQGVRWVKACEKLPNTSNYVPVKIDGEYYLGIFEACSFEDGGYVFALRDNHDNRLDTNENRCLIEWLDESSQPQVVDDSIYDSIYMEVVELVEKDNIQCEEYRATAKKLEEKFTINRKI